MFFAPGGCPGRQWLSGAFCELHAEKSGQGSQLGSARAKGFAPISLAC